MDWSASRYSVFERERSRPAIDLLNALPDVVPNVVPLRAIDLGCGPGNSTALLRARFPDAVLSGLDSSPDMLDAARKRLADVRFAQGDIAAWALDETAHYDLVFSNAALQWLPDHAALFPALLHRLAPGGTLAVQIPDNLDEPSHVLMRTIAADARWADRLSDAAAARADRHTVTWYDALLRANGAKVDAWRTTYHHRLDGGAGGIVRWLESTGLRPFLAALDPEIRPLFLTEYEAALAHAYPADSDGSVLLPFPRLFLVATIAF
ncbi:trans-aconitate 2-methyltransferase [Acetobacteraceae bacterium KSS8]|uniref:Trans-aconitate 2-methyltransferase n=1 Tax=Endosaccharibacter trunci TaxID=2812733 RepID=A0ABT1W3U4_9PROT|nr:trans-aconitate 2-methyltransferase [Acetobacteraceae bacterium KSS8]